MADCNEVLRELYGYLDGELGAVEQTEISRHLRECPGCYELLDFQAELRQVISRRCRDELPPGLAERIRGCFGQDLFGR